MKKRVIGFVLSVIVLGSCLFGLVETRAAEIPVLDQGAIANIDWCISNGILESQTLDEFQPGAVATVGDFTDWAYSAVVLKEKGGFPLAENHSFKQQRKWLDNKMFDAMIKNPADATQLSLDYAMGNSRRLKSSDPVTYDWVRTCASVIKNGRYPNTTESSCDPEIERAIKTKWAPFNTEGYTMTKIELLELMMVYLCNTI